MLSIISKNKWYFLIWAAVLITGSWFLTIHGKLDSHLLINTWHNPLLDNLMPQLTKLGDGVFMAGVALLLMFWRMRYSLILFSSFLSSSLVVQILKRFVFSDFPRPVKYFEATEYSLHLVNGLKYHSWFSFPSGHSATAFALFTGLALIVKNRLLKLVFLILAGLIAFSRVYLSQHFLIDSMVGSLIGVIFAVLFHYYFFRIDRSWIDKPFYKIFAAQ
jgi:membrane-associated phospholipid phosphatase